MSDMKNPQSLSMESGDLREQLLALLKYEFGSDVALVDYRIGNQRRDYLVLLAELRHPSLKVSIKFAGCEAPYPYPFEQTAALHRLVAAHTTIPMPNVIAMDVSYILVFGVRSTNSKTSYRHTTSLQGVGRSDYRSF
ncbi:MAG: hypothetical protein GY796_09485 [Chloroflexi bacterium]|nr:hypothetical protein [Chloroflexota bacterium]